MTGNIFLPLKPKLMKIEIYAGISHGLRLELQRAQYLRASGLTGPGVSARAGPVLKTTWLSGSEFTMLTTLKNHFCPIIGYRSFPGLLENRAPPFSGLGLM